MTQLLREVYLPCWQRVLGPLLVFQVGLALTALVLLQPLRIVLIERLTAFGADPFVGNVDLVGFVLHPLGATTLIVAAATAVLLRALELGGLASILWHGMRHDHVELRTVGYRLLARLPQLSVLSLMMILGLTVLALPVVAVGALAKAALLSDADIYFYLTSRPPAFWSLVAIVVAAALVAGIAAVGVVMRYGLAVPIVVLEGRTARDALREAKTRSRGRERRMARHLAVVFGLGALAVTLTTALLAGLFELADGSEARLRASVPLTLVFAFLATFLLTIVAALARIAVVTVIVHAYAEGRRAPAEVVPIPAIASSLRTRTALLVVAAVGVASVAQVVWTAAVDPDDRAVEVTAHRAGSSLAPENTLAALERAIAAGADVVEIDVQETRDGAVVLLHDTDLRRIAGLPVSIWELDLADVQAIDVGTWFDPLFADERIPTLEEFASAARGRVRLNVELKVSAAEMDLARRALAALRRADMLDQVMISSLDPRILARVRELEPDVPVGLIVATGIGNLARVDVDFVPLARAFATRSRIRSLTTRGFEVHVWGVDDEDLMVKALLDGAHNVIVGDPLRARAVVDWYRELTAAEKTLLRLRTSFDLRRPASMVPMPSP